MSAKSCFVCVFLCGVHMYCGTRCYKYTYDPHLLIVNTVSPLNGLLTVD